MRIPHFFQNERPPSETPWAGLMVYDGKPAATTARETNQPELQSGRVAPSSRKDA